VGGTRGVGAGKDGGGDWGGKGERGGLGGNVFLFEPIAVASVETPLVLCVPSVFGRSLRCQPINGVDTREEWHWSQACKSFKRAGVGTNGILDCGCFVEKRAPYGRTVVEQMSSAATRSRAHVPLHLPSLAHPCLHHQHQDGEGMGVDYSRETPVRIPVVGGGRHWHCDVLQQLELGGAFSVWTQFTVGTGKKVAARVEWHWSHTCKSFKRAGVGTKWHPLM
jgi:hypothetical protein